MIRSILFLIFYSLLVSSIFGQAVIPAFKSDAKLADEKWQDKNYTEALVYYQRSISRDDNDMTTLLRIARCQYETKEYKTSVATYRKYQERGGRLPQPELFCYAEALLSLGFYQEAVSTYRQLLAIDSTNYMVERKIWQTQNMKYLMEDSSHVAIKCLPVNSQFGEFGPALMDHRLVFVSNRSRVSLVDKSNSAGASFYRPYASALKFDTLKGQYAFGKSVPSLKEIHSDLNTGPLVFYGGGKKMIFITSSGSDKGLLGLFFAELKNGKWKTTGGFPYNSDRYSITSAAISQDGGTIIFSSDMSGGAGGKDLYRSDMNEGRWSSPRNLGEAINTPQDETFPYLDDRMMLYFSSNGLPGIGQLDLFKVLLASDSLQQETQVPENLGYPLNSPWDDFGLVFDRPGAHGFLSSNRKEGGFDDDLYEFDINLQQFPLTITALLKVKEHAWSTASEITAWADAGIALVNRTDGSTVYSTRSDRHGQFSLVIPKLSQYYIEITGADGAKHVAALELNKYRTDMGIPEIVLVRSIFENHNGSK